MLWNRLDSRAVVATASLLTSRDVIAPSAKDMAESPSSIGLGVYTSGEDQNDSTPKKPIQMLFVSPAAARDRSPAVNVNNAPGVVAGWYMIAQPSMQFEIRVTRVNSRKMGTKLENRLQTNVFVDGRCTNLPWNFQDGGSNLVDGITRGFVEKAIRKQPGFEEEWVRKFWFEKATIVTEKEDNYEQSETACICLRVDSGFYTRNLHHSKPSQEQRWTKPASRDVSEWEAAKHGKSLRLNHGCRGKVEKITKRLSKNAMCNARNLTNATVKVIVREAGWLRSRRLIDDNGSPCTFEMFTKLLKKDSSSQAKARFVKPKELVVGFKSAIAATSRKGQASQMKSGQTRMLPEVIDLT